MKKIDKEVANIRLFGSTDEQLSLQDLLARKSVHYVVIYFYPMDKTPLCTIQGHQYSKLLNEFRDLQALPIGISEGTGKGKKAFADFCKYNHLLLADSDHRLAKAFGCFTGEGGDEHVNSRVERKTYIINRNLEVIYSDDNVKYKTDAEATLNFIGKLT